MKENVLKHMRVIADGTRDIIIFKDMTWIEFVQRENPHSITIIDRDEVIRYGDHREEYARTLSLRDSLLDG